MQITCKTQAKHSKNKQHLAKLRETKRNQAKLNKHQAKPSKTKQHHRSGFICCLL